MTEIKNFEQAVSALEALQGAVGQLQDFQVDVVEHLAQVPEARRELALKLALEHYKGGNVEGPGTIIQMARAFYRFLAAPQGHFDEEEDDDD